jgi:NAD(P)-dependent dehydrogenase (short-subunit alcohol dehydrogenase family)
MLSIMNRSAEVEAAVKQVVSKFGKVGILVNNVGLEPLFRLLEQALPT